MSFLEITYGPMFSSKTQTLLEKINNFITFNEIHKSYIPKILIINSDKDTRSELKQVSNLTTHNKYKDYTFPISVENLSLNNLSKLENDFLDKFDYIAIDEAQFFEGLKAFVDKCLVLGKYIHCAGLIADSEKKTFGEMYLLIPYADEVNQLKAFCVECRYWYKNAVFTKWVGEEEKKSKIEIGANGKYIPVCGKHY
jgi:thymidine kinase